MSLFNKIRASIYGTVILFTVICLAMAGHFQSVLAASDLTRFVPFAIFVCAASLLIILCLLAFSIFFRERNPITTKFELIFLGMIGLLWLILGVYLATSDAQSADVECFADNSQTPLDDELASFHTDQYRAMYRVLMTFSLMNAVIIILTVLSMLALACFFRKGDTDKHMWQGPVTSYPWFSNYKSAKQSGGKISNSSILPVASAYKKGETVFTEKPERKASARRNRDYTSTQPYPSRNPYPTPPPKTTTPGKYVRQGSRNSPRGGSAAVPDLEHGGMLNPYSNPGRPRGSPRY